MDSRAPFILAFLLLGACASPPPPAPTEEERLVELAAATDPVFLGDTALRDDSSRVRAAALERLEDPGQLERIARTGRPDVRLIAAERLEDPEAIERVALTAFHGDVRTLLIPKVTRPDALLQIAKNEKDLDVRIGAAERIGDPAQVRSLLESHSPFAVRLAAIGGLEDQQALKSVVLGEWELSSETHGNSMELRSSALARIPDGPLLSELYQLFAFGGGTSTFDRRFAFLAFERTTDPPALVRTALESDNEARRNAAAARLSDPEALARLALESSDPDVREVAAHKITDPTVLEEILVSEQNGRVLRAALRNAGGDDLLLQTIERVSNLGGQSATLQAAVEQIEGEEALVQVARSSQDRAVARAATARITTAAHLRDIAEHAVEPSARRAALQRVEDQAFLARIVFEDREVEELALRRLQDPEALARVAREHRNDYLRELAVTRVTDQEVLLEVACDPRSARVSGGALERIHEDSVLARYVLNEEIDSAHRMRRFAALERIQAQEVLLEIALLTEDLGVAFKSMERLGDPHDLLKVAGAARVADIRRPAFERLSDAELPALGEHEMDPALRIALDVRRGVSKWDEVAGRAASSAAAHEVFLEALDYFPKDEVLHDAIHELCAALVAAGDEGRLDLLERTLVDHGSQQLAHLYLNCERSELVSAAHRWARRHGFTVLQLHSVPLPGGEVRWNSRER